MQAHRSPHWLARRLVASVIYLGLLFSVIGQQFVTRLSASEYGDRLANISSRGLASTEGNVMIVGFVISKGSQKRVLIRAAGPALTPLGVPGALVNPKLTIFNAAGTQIASNDDWGSNDPAAIASTAAQLGAFPFPVGSQDAAILTNLDPGNYTAHLVSSGATGVGLIEVYDVSGAPRLMNVSTRAQVGTESAILIAGIIVNQSQGTRRILLRAVGPTLANFGVPGVLSNPVIAVYNSAGQQISGNDNWGAGNDGALLTQAFDLAGAFQLPGDSRDSALIIELAPGNYTLHVAGVAETTGVALVEAYDLTVETLAQVSVTATTSGAPPGTLTFSRTGPTTNPLTINYSIGGSAVAGTDYIAIPSSITIPAGSSSASHNIQVIAAAGSSSTNKTVTATLAATSGYTTGTAAATVTIFFESGTLYLSQLRPISSGSSTAFGSGSIQLSPDGSFAYVNVSFSNLSSPQVLAYLRLDDGSPTGVQLFRLPLGQVSGAVWTIRATGNLSVADIIAALRAGRVYISIDSADMPEGELRGSYIRATGTQTFVAPPAPPALPAGTPTEAEAARFLIQATFGATTAEITNVRTRGYAGWITDQIAKTASSHRALTNADFAANNAGGQGGSTGVPNTLPGAVHRQAAWWQAALNGQDQLRQRVAFALSEIFVVSDANGTLNGTQEGLANYYDILSRNAFGNYRTLLEEVSLSPIMGVYLSHLRNAKAVSTSTAQPDENYAREIMQLFSIGLNDLQPDGTLKLNDQGLPVSTYNQTTITETAKIFTGWAFPSTNLNAFRSAPSNYISPMQLFPAFHDDTVENIAGGVQIPASQGGTRDLQLALDALFNHPNCPPFISRQLIQRLVTSNPSPAYVYRVARVFENNGSGVRGDLAAVVRAILLDYEARSPQIADNVTFGKLKEPLLRATALLRALGATDTDNRFDIASPEGSLMQAALRSPTVFNFFEPYYVQPGDLAGAGLYAPEFQILTGTTAVSGPNYLYNFVYSTNNGVSASTTSLAPLATQPGPLVDALNTLLCGGSMSATTRTRIMTALQALPTSATDTDRIRAATYLVITTQYSAVQM